MIDKKYPGLTVSIPLFFNQDESIDYKTLSRYLKELGIQKHISAVLDNDDEERVLSGIFSNFCIGK